MITLLAIYGVGFALFGLLALSFIISKGGMNNLSQWLMDEYHYDHPESKNALDVKIKECGFEKDNVWWYLTLLAIIIICIGWPYSLFIILRGKLK